MEGINVGLLDVADAGDINAADHAKEVACKVKGPRWLHRPSRSHLDSVSFENSFIAATNQNSPFCLPQKGRWAPADPSWKHNPLRRFHSGYSSNPQKVILRATGGQVGLEPPFALNHKSTLPTTLNLNHLVHPKP